MGLSKLQLKWKIFAFLVGFCALMLAILWLFQTVLLDTIYKNIKVLEIKRDADIIADNARNGNIDEIISTISQNGEIAVYVSDLHGDGIAASDGMPDRRIAAENDRLIALAQDLGGEFYQYVDPPQNLPGFENAPDRRTFPQALIYVKLADNAAGEKIAVIIHAVVSPVSATVTTLRYQLYVISGIMILLSIILAFFIAKRVSKPIEDISRSAQILAKGKYDTRFTAKGFREIVALSDTLNTAAAELGKVEELRRELMANVSHDLRTPLALIHSYAEMMLDFPSEATPEQIQVIIDETRRLTTLVNDVLDISKLESDIKKLDISNFNLTRSILETTERMGELLKNDGFDIVFIHDSDVFVDADKTKIDRVFYNLLINAVNYSDESRDISVEQTVSGGRVRISVTDGGEGIAEDDLPFIWDRYYKSGKSHKRAITGTGLGLSIVKKIIELHGGGYGVASELDRGSTFWFEIKI